MGSEKGYLKERRRNDTILTSRCALRTVVCFDFLITSVNEIKYEIIDDRSGDERVKNPN